MHKSRRQVRSIHFAEIALAVICSAYSPFAATQQDLPSVSTPSSLTLHLDDELLAKFPGDIDGLFHEWIFPHLRTNEGSDRWGIATEDNGVTVAKEVGGGMKRFCSANHGKFLSSRQNWGWTFTCNDQANDLIGELSLQVFKTRNIVRVRLSSPKQKILTEQLSEQRKLETTEQLRLNGPSGWITLDGNRTPFLRIGTLDERYVVFVTSSNGNLVPLEEVRRLKFNGEETTIEFKSGGKETVNSGRLYRPRSSDFGFYYEAFSGSGLGAFPIVLISDDGTPYMRAIDNWRRIESIELDESYVPIVAKRGEIPRPILEEGMAKLRPIIEERKRIELVQKKELERRKKLEDQRLSTFRKGLKIGDDTFCGPVIEVRGPMVKIAINAQLQGFGSEAWLKVGQIYPSAYGCNNTNGRLLPLSSIS